MPGAPPVRSKEQQGQWDWIIPFIPPVLRINRQTQQAFIAYCKSLKSQDLLIFLQKYSKILVFYWKAIGIFCIWTIGLVLVHKNTPEFALFYVICSGFITVGLNLRSDGSDTELSAYSVFNRGTQRMLGSLSAEQFENEIRHRQQPLGDRIPRQDDAFENEDFGNDDTYDEEIQRILELSLLEKKREERRQRRTSVRSGKKKK